MIGPITSHSRVPLPTPCTSPACVQAAWFLGGMSLPEMELTLQEMETKVPTIPNPSRRFNHASKGLVPHPSTACLPVSFPAAWPQGAHRRSSHIPRPPARLVASTATAPRGKGNGRLRWQNEGAATAVHMAAVVLVVRVRVLVRLWVWALGSAQPP